MHTFGCLTVGGAERQKGAKTDSPEFRDKLIKATDLVNEADKKAQDQAVANLTTVVRKLSDNSYLSP